MNQEAQSLLYFVLNKPYQVLCQFTKSGEKQTLANLDYKFPKDVYPVGRLDEDSEGLIILTNDTNLNNTLLHPRNQHKRTYWAQVDGDITEEAIKNLKKGINITIDGKPFEAKAIAAEKITPPEWLPDRNPPIRYRKEIPTSWVSLTITTGKNRQVRKMTASVGFPTLRLIRYSIEKINLEPDFLPGMVKKIERKTILEQLQLLK
ncbi:MAG: pseudouridine synthase [Bacteroidota bacterium]|nr:pseudouridine synthase [Bacteroidota bacterium]